jgi:hypothetical protein
LPHYFASSAITLLVHRNLGGPELCSRLRNPEEMAIVMSVPKAAMNEDSCSPFRQHDIRLDPSDF